MELASAAGADNLSDEILLERFTSRREEAAFAALVRRYGGLVFGVCRRVLHHEQDAEDAFQAVFCVLARKAGSIRKGAAVGAWLHAVACRIAQKALAQRRRRPTPMSQLPDVPAAEEAPEWARRELRPILDQEVNRLPEKYRQAFVLCHLEGRTNEQAAALLGCPLGTVVSRLSRARERLRGRLARRGLALSAGALSAALAGEAAAAMVPPALVQTATQAAVAFSGSSAMSSSVSGLAEGFLRSLSWARTVQIAGGTAGVAVAALILLLLLRRPAPAPVPAVPPVAAPATADQARIQGSWRVTIIRGGGLQAGPVPAPNLRWIFAADRATMSMFRQPGQPAVVEADVDAITAQFRLDDNRTPKEITLTLGPGITWPGIYKFDGDSLTLCLNQGGGSERPTTFSGEGPFPVFVLEREAAAPQPTRPAAGRGP
jgi:RNA polymerase sigma factor (sigma-70 family)